MKKRTFLLILLAVLVVFHLSGEEKLLKVPFSRQKRAYGCGQNTFRMIMGYWGEYLKIEKIYGYTGFNPSTSRHFQTIIQKHYSDFHFQQLDKSIETVITAIDENKPVMLEANAAFLPYLPYQSSGGHYIVAVGYNTDEELIYIRDPNSYYIESMSYEQIEKAWKGKNKTIFAIYRKDGRFVQPNKIVHYSDKAKPFGAEKEERKTPFYMYLIPSIYTVFNTSEDGITETNLKDDWLYTIKIQGLNFGHLSLERSPWLFQDDPFFGIGGNIGFNFGNKRVLFGNSNTLSPGVFRFLRTRTLDIRSFSSIKSVPALTMPALVIEGSGYLSLFDVSTGAYPGGFYPLPNPYASIVHTQNGNQLRFSGLAGGRLNVRHGINQTWGYISAAASVTSVKVYTKDFGVDEELRLTVFGGDATLGPVEGGFQFFKNDKARVLAYAVGLNLNLPKFSGGLFTVLDFIGLFRTYYQMRHEEFSIDNPVHEDIAVKQTVHRLELPMNLRFVDLIYGFDLGYAQDTFDSFTVGGRLLFNLFLPYFQGQLGYKYSTYSDGTDNHALHIGIYAGLW